MSGTSPAPEHVRTDRPQPPATRQIEPIPACMKRDRPSACASLKRAGPMSVATEVCAKVTSVLAEALVVDEADITPTAALQRDLGADSLDLLEIKYRLE